MVALQNKANRSNSYLVPKPSQTKNDHIFLKFTRGFVAKMFTVLQMKNLKRLI